jgi:DNA modification methylase
MTRLATDIQGNRPHLVLEPELENNKIRPEDRPVHDWFRFVLSFPPHLVRHYLHRFGATKRSIVLDPFCGTGTTLVECKKHGVKSVGIEAHPLAHFVSGVKLDWNIDPKLLHRHARRVGLHAIEELNGTGIAESVLSSNLNRCSHLNGNLRTLPEESLALLLEDSISPLPLHKVLVLLDQISVEEDLRVQAHERLAVAKTAVFNISNLHFGPEVGVSRQKKVDADVVTLWNQVIADMAHDLEMHASLAGTKAEVHLYDSRRPLRFLKPRSIDAVITSPPYPNEKDYTRTTRLESVLLGFVRDRHDLRKLKGHLLRSNTRNVFKLDDDDTAVTGNREIQRIAREIEARRIELGKTSGFERLYARVTKLYFGGMYRHFAELRPFLKPGAKLAYVVGDQASYLRIMIRTGQLLAEIAESLGYKVLDIELYRTRLATATKEQLREEVILLEWRG